MNQCSRLSDCSQTLIDFSSIFEYSNIVLSLDILSIFMNVCVYIYAHIYIYFMCMHSNFLLNFKAQTSQFYDNRLLWDSERMDKFMSTVDYTLQTF